MPLSNQEVPKETEKQSVISQLNQVLGDSGTERYGGFLYEEYNQDWRDQNRIDTVEEMRRGDATCRAALRAIKAPLLAAKWLVKTDGTSTKDKLIRDVVEDSLFHMKRTWKEFLREALAYLDFGHYAFELIWEKRGKYIVLKDLAPRIPHSILRWKLDDGSFGIQQQLRTDEVKMYTVDIPKSKLLIITNDKEGDDVTGQSILRSAYKHYQIKQLLYKIQSIAAERWGVGIPVVTLGEGAGTQEKDQAEEWGSNVRSNEQGYVVLPSSSYKLEILTPNGNPQTQAMETAIEHHGKQILMSILASFIGLGTDGTGSYALSSDQSSFFLLSLEDMASYISEQITQQVIKKIVDVNFGPQENYPYLTHAPLGEIDYGEMSNALSTLAGAGLIKINARMTQYIHDAFKLPEIPEKDLEMMEEQELEKELAALEQNGGDGMNVPEAAPSESIPTEESAAPTE